MNNSLWKMGIAGVLAVVAVGMASAQESPSIRFRPVVAHSGPVLTEGRIHRMKAVLKLTRVQERYWPPIEAALREMARELAHKSAAAEGGAPALDQAKVQRLASVAYPLLATLDEGQKREAMALVRAMGFGSLAASF